MSAKFWQLFIPTSSHTAPFWSGHLVGHLQRPLFLRQSFNRRTTSTAIRTIALLVRRRHSGRISLRSLAHVPPGECGHRRLPGILCSVLKCKEQSNIERQDVYLFCCALKLTLISWIFHYGLCYERNLKVFFNLINYLTNQCLTS